MCEFISAYKKDNDYFYLTKDDLKGKKFKEYKKELLNTMLILGQIDITTKLKIEDYLTL